MVRNRRLALVAGLGVVELWIVGLMIRSLGGGGGAPETPFSAAHFAAASAAQAATGGRVAKTLETGPTPHVVIDDDDATVTVSVRSGTTVGVSEQTQISGWVRGASRPVTVEKTDDGVRITRPDSGMVVSMGSFSRRLDVVVPPGTLLDVENAGSTTVTGLRADATLHSDDGSVAVTDLRGSLTAKTDNGRIELHDVDGPSIDITSDNGRVTLDRVRAGTVAIRSDDGRVDVTRSLFRGGKIETSNSGIRLALDPRSDVTVHARASSGKVVALSPFSLDRAGEDEEAPATIRVGNGSGRLEVASDDGSITILAGGM